MLCFRDPTLRAMRADHIMPKIGIIDPSSNLKVDGFVLRARRRWVKVSSVAAAVAISRFTITLKGKKAKGWK